LNVTLHRSVRITVALAAVLAALLAVSVAIQPRGPVAAVAGPTSWPTCAKMPVIAQLSSPEQKALADAVAKEQPNCGMPSVQCAFAISKRRESELWVHVDILIQDSATGGCTPPPGGWADHQYDANGNFVATFPGM
jgi:hypothetical protein